MKLPATVRRTARRLVPLVVAAGLTAVPAGTAQANCETNAIGVANSSGGTAAVAATQACAPAWGEPAGGDTGRRVG
jgi:hypothetical protein